MKRLIAPLIGLCLVACTEPGDAWYVSEPPAPPVDNGAEVLAILEANTCLNCHNGPGSSGLDVSTVQGLQDGGNKAGPAIIPCDPDASPLVRVMEGGIDDGGLKVLAMPQGGAPAASTDEMAVIRNWIASGAGIVAQCDDVPDTSTPTFENDIAPMFSDRGCMICHDGSGGSAGAGGLDVSSVDGLLAGGAKAGPSIVPCDPDASPIFDILVDGFDDGSNSVDVMPPPGVGSPFEADDIELLRAWVAAGAGVQACDGEVPEPVDDPDVVDESDAVADDDTASDSDVEGDAGPALDGESESDVDPEPESIWSADVQPILEAYCVGCHGPGGGNQPLFLDDLDTLDQVVLNNNGQCADMTGAECIVVMMETGVMPAFGGCDTTPDGAGCPTSAEIETVRSWVESGATH